MSLIDDLGQQLRPPREPADMSGVSAAAPAIPPGDGDAARDARDRLLDAALAASFPASDPLPWTLGRRATAPPER
ncbi:MAG: hypothetical protein KGJ32_00115 [Xanthomonadaceae bacterium]|nr:hypothetical protein [Xanthomonadaceae bacterium]